MVGGPQSPCCGVIGCNDLVLFYDEELSKHEGEDAWVCWLHGQLKLREDLKWWDVPVATATAELECGN